MFIQQYMLRSYLSLRFLLKVGPSDGHAIPVTINDTNFSFPNLEEDITNMPKPEARNETKPEARNETNSHNNGNLIRNIMFSYAYLIPFLCLVHQLSCNINLS